MSRARARPSRRAASADPIRIDWLRSAPFLAMQASVLLIPWLGFGSREAGLAGATYALGMFFVTAGYHRYFAHRAFRTSRLGQLVLAIGAQSTAQRGVLWWAGHHRAHHRASDGPGDVHSPSQGLLWSHVGWFLGTQHEEARLSAVRDLARFPELRWLERWYWVPPLALGAAIAAAGGPRLVVGGYLLGLFFVHHLTFCINSLAHRWGTQPNATGDDSRNNALMALLTFGEGWHNNHHFHPWSARQGFRAWQVDLTYLALRGLERLGLVWDLHPGPGEVRARARRRVRPAAALAALVVLALPRAAAGEADAVERFSGLARAKDGALLYREEHEVRSLGGRVVEAATRYLAPDGAPLAELRTDFTRDLEAPSYVFRDLRSAAAERVEVTPEELRLEAGGRSRTLARPAALATGQGLDRLVRGRLPELEAGSRLVVSYAVPSRLDAYRFRIRALPSEGGPTVKVRVELASQLLRLLAPDLEVEYDRATRRLLRYRGASNLAFGERGDHPQVEIRYAYPGAPMAAGEGTRGP